MKDHSGPPAGKARSRQAPVLRAAGPARKFFGDSPAGIERDGYLADLPSVTCESLTAAYQEMLRTAQLDVICLGADEDVVRRMTLEKLAGVQREPAQLENYLFMPAQPVEHFREEMDLVQAKLCMLFTWNQCAKPEQLNAFRLAMSVFGGSATSRLFLNVREKAEPLLLLRQPLRFAHRLHDGGQRRGACQRRKRRSRPS